MTQKTFERVRRIELQLGVAPSHYEPGAPAPATHERERLTEHAGAETGLPAARNPGEAVRL
jgi:hypothetical protein